MVALHHLNACEHQAEALRAARRHPPLPRPEREPRRRRARRLLRRLRPAFV